MLSCTNYYKLLIGHYQKAPYNLDDPNKGRYFAAQSTIGRLTLFADITFAFIMAVWHIVGRTISRSNPERLMDLLTTKN